jgi:hypothetical protein
LAERFERSAWVEFFGSFAALWITARATTTTNATATATAMAMAMATEQQQQQQQQRQKQKQKAKAEVGRGGEGDSMGLAAEVVDDPEDESEEKAQEDGGGEGEGDGPVTASPLEVAGEAADGEVEAIEAEDDGADDEEKEAKEDEGAAQVRHGTLGGCQQGCGLAEEFGRLAGLGEDADRAGEFGGLLADTLEVGVEAGEDDDAACGELAVDVGDEGETVAARHGDIAEQEVGFELAAGGEGFIGRIGCGSCEAALLEDEGQCVGYETIIIDDENSLHGALLKSLFACVQEAWQ